MEGLHREKIHRMFIFFREQLSFLKMAAKGKSVDLGYFNGDYPAWDLAADYEAWELTSRHFPSKVGGRPAWLDLLHLPSSNLIKVTAPDVTILSLKR